MSAEKKDVQDGLHHHVVTLDNCGPISVFVQGDLDKQREGVVFLTLHDVGHSYLAWVNFINTPEMESIRRRSLFLHVVLPGQEPGNPPDLPATYTFPTMQNLGLNMVTVLDQLRVQQVVVLGEGAGANIGTRFAMWHPARCHGVVAINCSAGTSMGRFLDRLKDRLKKYGGREMNEKNVWRFAEAYKKRIEIMSQLNEKLKVDILLIAGTKSKAVTETENMHRQLKPGICSMIKIEDVYDVLKEATAKTAEAILLFCQGMSLMPTVQTKKLSRQGSTASTGSNDGTPSRKMSMEELDAPNLRRLSLTAA